MSSNPAPLPYGWTQQVDPQSGHAFYVDTKADPPRSIWTHPYEDEAYLKEHPNVRNKARGSNSFGSDASLALPPPEMPRRHSYNGRDGTPIAVPPPKHKEGFFKKLKKKAINSMEQHDERKRQQQQQMLMQQQMYNNQFSGGTQYGAPQYAYPQSYGGMGSSLGRRRGGMGGGMALPLLGGMAGGLLLGDVIGNDFGNGGGGGWDGGGGGGWDGGGGGGDWGGGGF